MALVRWLGEELVAAEPRARVEVDVKHQYSNIRRNLEAFPEVVEHAARAIRGEGLEVVRVPIRGGTDGSILSARRLPTRSLHRRPRDHSVREWGVGAGDDLRGGHGGPARRRVGPLHAC